MICYIISKIISNNLVLEFFLETEGFDLPDQHERRTSPLPTRSKERSDDPANARRSTALAAAGKMIFYFVWPYIIWYYDDF